jgi:hypothetical protein
VDHQSEERDSRAVFLGYKCFRSRNQVHWESVSGEQGFLFQALVCPLGVIGRWAHQQTQFGGLTSSLLASTGLAPGCLIDGISNKRRSRIHLRRGHQPQRDRPPSRWCLLVSFPSILG